jgi:hypothetical protein
VIVACLYFLTALKKPHKRTGELLYAASSGAGRKPRSTPTTQRLSGPAAHVLSFSFSFFSFFVSVLLFQNLNKKSNLNEF